MKAQEITIKKRNWLILLMFIVMAPLTGFCQLTFEENSSYEKGSTFNVINAGGNQIGMVEKNTSYDKGKVWNVIDAQGYTIGMIFKDDFFNDNHLWHARDRVGNNEFGTAPNSWKEAVKKYYFKKKK
jgi:hypothetical protein